MFQHNKYNSEKAGHTRLPSLGFQSWSRFLAVSLQVTHTRRLTAGVCHTRLTALCPGLPGWAGTRKVKPIWILLKQETMSGSGICWAICKSAPRSRQITTPAPHHSVFYKPDALPAAQPTASKHRRQQPAGDLSHKPGGRLPLLSARPAVTPATLKRAATYFAAWWTEAQWVRTVCLRLLPDSVATAT